MKNKPLVSILTPTFNRPDWLEINIHSVLAQTYANWEQIIINDYGTPVDHIVKKFNDPRIKLINHSENKGLAASRNTGLRNCSGDIICCLDDDDSYYPTTLEFRLWFMQKNKAEIINTHSLKTIMERFRADNNLEYYRIVRKELYWHSEPDSDLILIQNLCPCNCIFFSRKAWEDANYWYDEELTTTEDHDFNIALTRKHNSIQTQCIDTEATWRNDQSQMTGTRNFAPNWIKVFKKWRHTAKDLEYVTNAQNEILRRVGLKPEDYNL